MRVLQINSVYGYGSTGKIVASIHQKLLNESVESFVIYSRKMPKNVNMKNVYRIYSPLGVAVHAGLALVFDKHGLYSSYSTNKIITKIKEINPDIVHIHVLHGFYCNYQKLFEYLKSNQIKVIYTLHDCWAFTGFCSHYDFNNCDSWKIGCNRCKFRNVYPYRIFSNSNNNFKSKQLSYNNMDMIIVSPSKWLDNQINESILKNKKHVVINNNINLSDFYYEPSNYRKRFELIGKKIILAVASSWTIQKGINEIIKLSKKVKKNCQVVILGVTKNQMSKIPKNILVFPRLEKEELRKWYSVADVFVNCTLQENYPTVNLEATACGLPIITYDTGGCKETITKMDWIVERYDLDAIARIIDETVFYKKGKQETARNNMEDEYYKLYLDRYKSV